MTGWFFDGTLAWLSTLLSGAVQLVWKLMARAALTSPDTTLLPQVGEISQRAMLVVNAGYVLAILAAGVLVMTRETLQVRYGIGELAPRLVLGLVAANLATPLCQAMITTANALTQALTGDSLTSGGVFSPVESTLTRSLRPIGVSPQEQVLLIVIVALILVLTLRLVFGWIIRVGVLIVLTGIAPLALACHGLPQTDPVARLWWRSMLAVLLVVTGQAFALHTTLTVFLSPGANLPVSLFPLDPGNTLNLLVVACLLWATLRIPALARRYAVTGGGRTSITGSMIRVLVVQQLTRGLGGRGAVLSLVSRGARRRP